MSFGTNRELISGTQVAGYQIEHELGRGAMAVVYLAIQLNLHRRVALKVLADELAANNEFVVRFFNEARAAAALSHPHIVQAYDAGIAEGGIHYFAMEYVEGETLLERIERQGYLRPGPGLQLAVHVADALNYGWQRQRLTHGDIKPENVMINSEGQCKVADFGLAKIADHDFEGSEIMLTPLYAAPEMIRGEAAKGDCRSDIYAFGATLYHMFSGTPPYPGERAQEVMQRHLSEPLEPLRERNRAIPGQVSDVVGRLLSKDAGARPETWERVLSELREILRQLNSPAVVVKAARPVEAVQAARRSHAGGRSRHRGWAGKRWVALIVAVALCGVLALLVARRGQGPRAGSETGGRVPAGENSADRLPASAAAAPGDAEDGTAALAPADDWQTLERRLNSIANRDQALALLTAYASRHGGEMPAEYHALRARYEGVGQDAERGNAAANATALLRNGSDAGVTPRDSGENTAAAAGLSGADSPPVSPPAELSSVGDADTTAELSGPRDRAFADVLPSLTLNIDPPDRRADAADVYLFRLSSLAYRVPVSMEAAVRSGREWLLTHGESSEQREVISFAVATALPALEEALPKLVANSDILAGARLPGRTYAHCTVHEIGMEKLTLRERTRHGVMFRSVAWSRQPDPVLNIVSLSRKLALKRDSWSDRRPYLSLLLFTGHGKTLWDEALSGLPLTPEARRWQALRQALEEAAGEGEALALWQALQSAVAAGNRTTVYRLATQLRATRSRTARRHEDRLVTLMEKTRQAVPSHAGGQLVRDAVAFLNQGEPGRAVQLLTLAKARYGHADFPERDSLEPLLEKALGQIPLPGWLTRAAERHPLTTSVPFATAGVPMPQYLPMSLFLAAESATGERHRERALWAPVLRGPCLLQLGDWAGATAALRLLSDADLDRAPADPRRAVVFSRACVEARFRAEPDEKTSSALHALALPESDAMVTRPHFGRTLLLELDLFNRGVDRSRGGSTAAEDIAPAGPSEGRRRLFLNRLSCLLKVGNRATAKSVLNDILHNQDVLDAWGFDSQARVFLVHIRQILRDGTDRTPARLLFTAPLSEWELRLAISAVLEYGAWSEQAWLRTCEVLELRGESLGIAGGSAVYEAVLARVSDRLSAGALTDAWQTVDWILEKPSACLLPYYARLCFLRWGLLQLASRGGGADLQETIRASTCVSSGEKTIAAMYADAEARRDADRLAADDWELRFWQGWLLTTIRVGRGDRDAPGAWAGAWGVAALPAAERLLLDSLGAWGRHVAAAPAAQD